MLKNRTTTSADNWMHRWSRDCEYHFTRSVSQSVSQSNAPRSLSRPWISSISMSLRCICALFWLLMLSYWLTVTCLLQLHSDCSRCTAFIPDSLNYIFNWCLTKSVRTCSCCDCSLKLSLTHSCLGALPLHRLHSSFIHVLVLVLSQKQICAFIMFSSKQPFVVLIQSLWLNNALIQHCFRNIQCSLV